MIELTEQQWQEDEYDPDEGMNLMNEVMAEDDANDPLRESYQHYGKKA